MGKKKKKNIVGMFTSDLSKNLRRDIKRSSSPTKKRKGKRTKGFYSGLKPHGRIDLPDTPSVRIIR